MAVRANHADVLDPQDGRVGAAQDRPGYPGADGRNADSQEMDAGTAGRGDRTERGARHHPQRRAGPQ